MGKSPGKWIKTVLFGKKHSKSSLSENATLDRKASAKPPVDDLADPVISNPCQFTDTGAGNMEFDEGKSGTPVGTIDSVPVDQGLESRSNFVSVPVSDDEMRRQCQAATKAQAVFRGFLARRAFMVLKGIIRLQALVRGHLVRRQAVATLRCMKAIVKFQALARGRRVRLSHTMPEMRKKYILEFCQVDPGAHVSFGLEKLATNAYVHKLLLSLPNVMPLSLQYDGAEPNSASNWLERWSLSRFWEPPGRPKKVLSSKPRRKQGGPHLVENEAGKSKRTIRKASSSATRVSGTSASSEIDKPKRKPGKVISHQTESVQEQDQNEFEKVKCNLRKVSASVIISSEKLEMEPQKPQQSLNTALNSEKEIAISVEKPADSDLLVDKIAPVEASSKAEVRADQVDPPHDDRPLIENLSTENGEKMESASFSHDEVGPKEVEDGKENQKIRKRRSLTTKQEYPDNVSLNTPSLPSYMTATQSAKAKLKLQGSSKFSEDGEEVGYVRRHSLPASINGKLSSLSPRIQKPVKANGKGVSKTNRSITSSRDERYKCWGQNGERKNGST